MKVAAFAPSTAASQTIGISGAFVSQKAARRAFLASAASTTALAGWTMNFGGHSVSCVCASCGPHAASCDCATCSMGHTAGCACQSCLNSHSLSCQCANCMSSERLTKSL